MRAIRSGRRTEAGGLVWVALVVWSFLPIGVTRAGAEPEGPDGDRAIQAQVEKVLGEIVGPSSFSIRAVARGGVVTLTGRADTLWEERQAAQLAASVAGVREVQNQMILDLGSHTDSQIRGQLFRALTGSTFVQPPHLSIRVERGGVFLRGQVESARERFELDEVAKKVKGVRFVDNEVNVTTVPSRPDDSILAEVQAALEKGLPTEAGRVQVTVRDREVVLSGVVSGVQAWRKAEELSWVKDVVYVNTEALKINLDLGPVAAPRAP